MTSFRLDIGPKSRSAGRFLGRVRMEILRALMEQKGLTGLTQQRLAAKLKVHRSTLNRQLLGEANLPLRAVAELAWALDREIVFELRAPERVNGQNASSVSSTVESRAPTVFGRATASGSTTQGSCVSEKA